MWVVFILESEFERRGREEEENVEIEEAEEKEEDIGGGGCGAVDSIGTPAMGLRGITEGLEKFCEGECRVDGEGPVLVLRFRDWGLDEDVLTSTG